MPRPLGRKRRGDQSRLQRQQAFMELRAHRAQFLYVLLKLLGLTGSLQLDQGLAKAMNPLMASIQRLELAG
ncbi:MAG: hypothetical protein GVY22_14500 [Gammaproteobacteria bacterium]|nr:hypothetical protein [Gammaproteobacteria bacterium]